MRAGPLSNTKVIDILNRFFVPVYTVNEDYAPKGPAPAEEKAERESIFKQGYERHWSVGKTTRNCVCSFSKALPLITTGRKSGISRMRCPLERNQMSASSKKVVLPSVCVAWTANWPSGKLSIWASLPSALCSYSRAIA